jgi:hypothetical protein
LLGRAPLVVEPDDGPIGESEICHDEADAREQLADVMLDFRHDPSRRGPAVRLAGNWRSRRDEPLIGAAIDILGEKFKTVEHYGPQQLAIFHDAANDDEIAMHARRAFELVPKLLSLL